MTEKTGELDHDASKEPRRVLWLLPLFGILTGLAVLFGYVGLVAASSCLAAFAAAASPHAMTWRWRWRGVALGLTLTSALFRVSLFQAQGRLDGMAKAVDEQGVDGLSDAECLTVYLIGFAMGLGGYVAGYPEAAAEQLGLYWKGAAARPFHGDFLMGTEKVAKPLKAFLAASAAAKSGELKPMRIALSGSTDGARIYLAANPLSLTAKAGPDGVAARATIDVKYPKKARTPIFVMAGVQIAFEEGLFWVLQERGWLHPYKAVWSWTLTW